ncbi:hypothetical protein H920_05591 [Fukomys damarensis]|uniref:Uncharacterized protein n=1 Tax=Fukomys damarensis TaxID=885580 RepID=A0A091DRS2_FUKDA|nr:hypothetical protein H920_05591 [Fukomys damarensis]
MKQEDIEESGVLGFRGVEGCPAQTRQLGPSQGRPERLEGPVEEVWLALFAGLFLEAGGQLPAPRSPPRCLVSVQSVDCMVTTVMK